MENEIIKNTERCDDCGVFYDKVELVRHFQGHYIICRKCISDYDRMYKKEKK